MDGEKAPFLVVAGLSAFAWGMGQFYDRVVTAPIVEYSITDEIRGETPTGAKPLHELVVVVSNLTDDKIFNNITIWVWPSAAEKQEIEATNIVAFEPYVSGSTQISTFPHSISFSIGKFAPGATFRATANVRANRSPSVSFAAESEPVKFVRKGIISYLVRQAQWLIVTAIVAIPILLIIFLVGAPLWPRLKQVVAAFVCCKICRPGRNPEMLRYGIVGPRRLTRMRLLHKLSYVITFCLMPCVASPETLCAENSGIFIIVIDENKAPVQSTVLKGPSTLDVAGTTDINGIFRLDVNW